MTFARPPPSAVPTTGSSAVVRWWVVRPVVRQQQCTRAARSPARRAPFACQPCLGSAVSPFLLPRTRGSSGGRSPGLASRALSIPVLASLARLPGVRARRRSGAMGDRRREAARARACHALSLVVERPSKPGDGLLDVLGPVPVLPVTKLGCNVPRCRTTVVGRPKRTCHNSQRKSPTFTSHHWSTMRRFAPYVEPAFVRQGER